MKLVLIFVVGTVFQPQRGKANPDHDLRLVQSWIYVAQWRLTGPSENDALSLDSLQEPSLKGLWRWVFMGPGPFPIPRSGTDHTTRRISSTISPLLGTTTNPHNLPLPDKSLDELTRSSRSPILRTMHHMLAQLRQIIDLGTPSLK
ncbi:uncharacterized protein ATNIH1004_003053 [Aspergillus tanneri]|uniref:Uncharacterized protein n=1 Tax=Aspergillus tanneri TaxID=1220188 RepID=A0A5M9N0A1_9EURO|nr:uncharacterized protein ATNIH1004_003053 [Aspergillus tanneri]KAA8650369.1 hypothetical protein ATNIH1004_003053 [Aspergillus tanneri]